MRQLYIYSNGVHNKRKRDVDDLIFIAMAKIIKANPIFECIREACKGRAVGADDAVRDVRLTVRIS